MSTQQLRLALRNDWLPPPLGHLAPSAHRAPANPNYTDDDGWTAEAHGVYRRLDTVSGRTLRVVDVFAGAAMLTQRRSSARFEGLRQDLVLVGGSSGFAVQHPSGWSWLLSGGVGWQQLGPQGLLAVQEWFHRGPIRGRIESLQRSYQTSGLSVVPVTSAQVMVDVPVRADLAGRAGVKTLLPLGPGIALARLEATLQWSPLPAVKVAGGVVVDGAFALADSISFLAVDGIRAGAHLGVGVQVGPHLTAYSELRVGGLRDEPNWVTLGISLSSGPWSRWLDSAGPFEY